jgi:hypothetical protein
MSTAPFLTLISEVMPVSRRDFYMFDPTLLNPNNANPVIDGEWLELDANYKLIRGSGNGTSNHGAFQLFAERGRYDTQAIGKTTVLFIGGYEAETTVTDTTSMAVGNQLVIADVTVGGLTRRGLLKLPAGAGTYFVVARVTRLPGGGKVRYQVPAAGLAYPVVVP